MLSYKGARDGSNLLDAPDQVLRTGASVSPTCVLFGGSAMRNWQDRAPDEAARFFAILAKL
ncbi:hypothetical protein CEV31_0218 [Brucella thiophenivorans]|uniref:Uncharacterized protein n=1 Tax=Brucella thiophenivorans TaxID=571255 RepID=A0A256G6Q4_9HYPH|nr:hypothetical protein CEV31_0218 [Brucella thiophenivorans]